MNVNYECDQSYFKPLIFIYTRSLNKNHTTYAKVEYKLLLPVEFSPVACRSHFKSLHDGNTALF